MLAFHTDNPLLPHRVFVIQTTISKGVALVMIYRQPLNCAPASVFMDGWMDDSYSFLSLTSMSGVSPSQCTDKY